MHHHGREQSPSSQKGPSSGKWNDACRMQPSCGDENGEHRYTVPFPKFWSLGPQTLESDRSVHHLLSFVTHGREMCEGYLACLSFSFFICRKKFQHLHHRVVGDTYATELSTLPHKKYTLQHTIISIPVGQVPVWGAQESHACFKQAHVAPGLRVCLNGEGKPNLIWNLTCLCHSKLQMPPMSSVWSFFDVNISDISFLQGGRIQ